jgi:hypothetical protein
MWSWWTNGICIWISTKLAMIKNRLDGVLVFFNVNRRSGRDVAWEQFRIVIVGQIQSSSMHFGVNAKFLGQLEGIVRCCRLGFQNFEGSNIMGIELGPPALLLDP